MTEDYKGVKFKTVFLSTKLPLRRDSKKLSLLGEKLVKEKINLERKAGNLSVKKGNGFIITATNTLMDSLKKEDFVLIKKIEYNKRKVFVSGLKKPSSETIMHAMLYKKRKINVIIHFHNSILMKKALKKKEIPNTIKYHPYGTIALAKEITRNIKKNNFLLIKKHGFIVLGESIRKAEKNLNELIKLIQEKKQ